LLTKNIAIGKSENAFLMQKRTENDKGVGALYADIFKLIYSAEDVI
jgi:hypothetical protein